MIEHFSHRSAPPDQFPANFAGRRNNPSYVAAMHLDFWQARWTQQRIGFHRADINPYLMSHGPEWLGFESWDDPAPLSGKRILVPLCGKSVDLRWLAAAGADVVGIEFVEQAVVAFFEEQGLPYERVVGRSATLLRSTEPSVKVGIWVANFFEIGPEDVGPIDAAFDRAALVAVEPEARPRYARQLAHLCSDKARLLLVTFEHDIGGGPPFAVPRVEVSALFAETFNVVQREDADILVSEPQFRQRGAQYCRELVWLGTRA